MATSPTVSVLTSTTRKYISKTRHIPTLDGWRAIAILLVLAHHTGTGFFKEAEYYSVSPTRWGTWGVPVFFALSGILITKLLLEEFDRTAVISLKSFYTRRAFRILPPATVYILTITVLGLLVSKMELASTFLFFRNYLTSSLAGPYTAHFWSLAVEEHFYLIWPGLLVLLGVRRGFVAAAAISLALALWASVDFHFHFYARLFPHYATVGRSDLRLGGLFCGCSMAFLLNGAKYRQWLIGHYRFWMWILSFSIIILCLRFHPYFETFWISALLPWLMLGTALHPGWRISRLLDLGPIRWIGRISYSLYLWQQLFLVPAWEPKAFPVLQSFPVNVVLSFLCAWISYRVVEAPLIRVGHTFAARFHGTRKVAPIANPRSVGIAASEATVP